MREDDYKPIIIDHMSLIGDQNGENYYVKQQCFDYLKKLAQIYDVKIITGAQKQKFTLGKLKPLNIA